LKLLRALWAHARPRRLPWLWLLLCVGVAYGYWERAANVESCWDFPLPFAAWGFLHAGTLWLNAARDKDEGEVLFGGSEPVPEQLSLWAYAALVLAAVLAFASGVGVGVACTGCCVLAVLYSHPKIAWKAHPLGGPLINVVGYGLLTPAGGMAVASSPVNGRSVLTLAVIALTMLGLTFAAQAWQEDEDKGRGDRTLVATHGPRVTLWSARLLIDAASLLAMGAALYGWFPRSMLAALPGLIAVDLYFWRWLKQPNGGDAHWAKRLVRGMAMVAAVAVVASLVEYGMDWRRLQPFAGRGTARIPVNWDLPF
jgi:4-hydroxybenzoate polyprenyltransferase